jgi:hypothetical protein
MPSSFDHLVIGVNDLDEGTRWLEEHLGVPLSGGGEHLKMGTYNRLLRIGERSYLELIAVNPNGETPNRPRWYDLDNPARASQLRFPSLLTWAASTSDIGRVAADAIYEPGAIHPMSRNALKWLITIRDDGSMPEGGILPSLIEWGEGVHPSDGLPDRSISLKALEIHTPEPIRAEEALASIGFVAAANKVCIMTSQKEPWLRARLDTPKGVVHLSSNDRIATA